MLILASPFPPPYINIYFLKMAVTYIHLIFILKENEEMKCGHGSTQTRCSKPNKHAYMHRPKWWIYYSSKLSMWEALQYKDTDCTMVKISDVGESWKFIMLANIVTQWNLHSSFLKGPCAETDKHRLTVAGQH